MKRLEDRLQSRCRLYLDVALPRPGWWSALRHEKKQTPMQGQRQKALGVHKGLPDIAIWYVTMFHGVELKVGKNDTSDAQDGFGAAMVANGFRYVVIRSVVELDAYLRAAGVPVEPSMRVLAMHHDAALAEGPAARTAKPRKPRAMARVGTARDARWQAKRYGVAKLV